MTRIYNFADQIKLQIETAAYLDVDKRWEKMVEAFSYVRIYYIRSGSAVLHLIDKTITMEEGYMYFIPAFSILGGTCNHMGHYFVHLVPDILSEHFLRLPNIRQKVPLSREIADFLFTKLARSYQVEDSIQSHMATESIMQLILSYFINDSPMLQNSGGNTQRFLPVLEYIDRHIAEKLYVKDLAALLYLDDIYFSNLFKKTFGLSVQQYILNKKLDKAKVMLASDMPICDIAEKLNFFDAATFTRFFKSRTSYSPKDFRKKLYGMI